jgi:hypothetical protein
MTIIGDYNVPIKQYIYIWILRYYVILYTTLNPKLKKLPKV